jgi:putative transposase
MPRSARHVVPNYPHHITQRGNNRQDVFFTDDDYHLYLALLKRHALEHGLDLLGYCLMTNHVHLIAIPHDKEALASAVGKTHWKYAQIINRLHKRSGHLWQDRFYSCALDGPHLLQAMAYLELNPVRAQMVRRAWEYPWSSAKAHVEGVDAGELLDLPSWTRRMPRRTGSRSL